VCSLEGEPPNSMEKSPKVWSPIIIYILILCYVTFEITHGNEVRIMPISLKNLPYKVGLMSIFLEDGGKPQMPISIQ
jgi:hypothetical protein